MVVNRRSPRAWQRSAVGWLATFAATFCWMLLRSSIASADDLQYSQLDASTVRVFSFMGVKPVKTRSSTGRTYVLGTPEAGHGSGLIVSGDGLILTARHVV